MNSDPQLPIWFEVLGLVIPIAAVVLGVLALITLVRSQRLSNGERVCWTVAVVILPIAGPAVWLIVNAITRPPEPPVA